MKKITFVIIIVALLTIVGGCQSQTYDNSYALVNTIRPDNLSDSITPTTPSPVSLTVEERYKISHSSIETWNELEAKVFLNEIASYGGHNVLYQTQEDQMVEYSIKYPGNWTLNGTVFSKDFEQKKIGELFPVFLLEPNAESFISFKILEEYTEDELISKEIVNFGVYKGFKIISQVTTSETWYPHTYYLTDGTYVFGISLYSYSEERDQVEEQLFDDIVSTFCFK